jgi:hypothetical protein
MRQTKSLVHFEILYVYSKVSFELWVFFWTKFEFGFRTFFWLSVNSSWRKQSLLRKAKSRCFGLVCFFKNIIFRLSKKMLWGLGAIFLRLLVRTEENKLVKEFVCFSTTDVFVPVSQLSTRDLFYFLENLKI